LALSVRLQMEMESPLARTCLHTLSCSSIALNLSLARARDTWEEGAGMRGTHVRKKEGPAFQLDGKAQRRPTSEWWLSNATHHQRNMHMTVILLTGRAGE
jgi:hypothetical protein